MNTHLAYIGLGANLGAARATLQAAADAIAQLEGVARLELSRLYVSAPVEASGPDYTNAVARVHTTLAPHELLAALQAIELAHGRTRPAQNAPRTLDLDLLLYDDLILNTPALILPHPRMHLRAFVLRPLLELWPEVDAGGAGLAGVAQSSLGALGRGGLQALLAACGEQRIAPLQRVRMVVAYTSGARVIGRDGGMPWHLPADLAHFKRSTLGHPVIMGRKTWLSIGKPLPGRENIVLSRDAGFEAPGALCRPDLRSALSACANAELVCIIGGGQVFQQALALTDEIIATEIHAAIQGDSYFPELAATEWQECARHPAPPENGISYEFVHYQRR